MSPNIEFKCSLLPEAGDFFSKIVCQFEYLGNVSNIYSDEPQESFPTYEKLLEHYSELIKSSPEVFSSLDFEISRKFKNHISIQRIEYFIGLKEKVGSYKEVVSHFSNVKEINNNNPVYNIIKEYIYHWMSYLNYRALAVFVEREKNSIVYNNLLKFSIYNEIQVVKTCNNLKELLEPLLWSYYYGYIIGNIILQNLFYARIRFFLKKEKVIDSSFSENDFIEVFRSIKTTEDDSNSASIKEAFLILGSFIKKRIKENEDIKSESDIFILQSKLQGLLKLTRVLHRDHSVINQNTILSNLKDFFEEIHCDGGAIRKYKEIRYNIAPPRYIHWILKLSLFPRGEINSFESMLRFKKQRIFLSNPVFVFLEDRLKNKSKLSINEVNKIVSEIDGIFSEYDERVIVPLYLLYDYKYTFLMSKFYSFDFFCKAALVNDKMKLTRKEVEEYFEVVKMIYSGASSVKDLSKEKVDVAIYLHNYVSSSMLIEVIEKAKSFDHSETMMAFQLYQKHYPYCGYIHQEIAILNDQNKHYKTAFKNITDGLCLEPNDKLMWQSFRIIVKNLLN